MANESQRQGLRSALEKKIYEHLIALRAWQIWKEEGCPVGKEVEHWLQAERELEERHEGRVAQSLVVSGQTKKSA
jgi:hypothetical protein